MASVDIIGLETSVGRRVSLETLSSACIAAAGSDVQLETTKTKTTNVIFFEFNLHHVLVCMDPQESLSQHPEIVSCYTRFTRVQLATQGISRYNFREKRLKSHRCHCLTVLPMTQRIDDPFYLLMILV